MKKQDILFLEVKESEKQYNLGIKKPTMRYFDEFLGHKASIDMLELKLFPNAKEITESFSAYRAVVKNFSKQVNLNDPNVNLVVVGDGSTPRTAATFAFRSQWNCISIDPNLNLKDRWRRINRLHCIKKNVEDVTEDDLPKDFAGKPTIIVAVHSHANLINAFNTIEYLANREIDIDSNIIGVVALPCCVPQILTPEFYKNTKEYYDWGVWSPDRLMKVWWINAQIP